MLARLFQWYHNAPVEGRIVGAKAKTVQYAGHGDIIYQRHVCPSDITPNQSYIQYEKINPRAPVSAITAFGISAEHRATGWGKVVAIRKQKDGPSNGSHQLDVDIDGQIIKFDITDIKRCIPSPLSGAING